MKTAEELQQKLDEINDKVKGKRNELATAMLEGNDNQRLVNELARLESERGATEIAIEKAKQKELERQEREREAKRAEADQKFDQLNAEALDLLNQSLEKVKDIGALMLRVKAIGDEQGGLIATYNLRKGPFISSPDGWFYEIFMSMVRAISNKFDFFTLYMPDSPLFKKFGKDFVDLRNGIAPVVVPWTPRPGNKPKGFVKLKPEPYQIEPGFHKAK